MSARAVPREVAHANLRDALADVIRAESDERVRKAYEHGYQAGLRDAKLTADKIVYRRGYLAGYTSGRRRADSRATGPATDGTTRPQLVDPFEGYVAHAEFGAAS